MKTRPALISLYQVMLIALLCSIQLTAQNQLYTTELFGIDGAMMGGAVTSGVDDVSMTFYNPAAIHKVSPQVSISLVQPALRTFGFNEFWSSNDSSSTNIDLRLKPTLISFKLKLKKLDLAFLKISKSELTDEFSTQQEFINDNLLTTQYFDYEYSGRDNWFGVGTNFKLNPNLYLGVSEFVSIARFTYNNTILLEELDVNQNNRLSRYFNSTFDGTYRNMSFITKLGLLLDTDKHDLGITITTPAYLRTFKSGELFSANISTIDNNTNVDQIIDNDISPIIKTPWEFNLGYSLALNTTQKIWLNTSYHTRIAEYDMVRNASPTDANISWKNGSKAVFNFALAYSHLVNPKFELSGGFRTNNFAYENKLSPTGAVRNTILDGNHIHFVVGSKIIIYNKNTILLGIDYGTMRNIPEEENFEGLTNLDVLAPNLRGLEKNNISILLTYGFIIDEIRQLNSKK